MIPPLPHNTTTLVLRRAFTAPRLRVFRAWIEPEACLVGGWRGIVYSFDMPESFLVVSLDAPFPTAPNRTGRAAFTASGSLVSLHRLFLFGFDLR